MTHRPHRFTLRDGNQAIIGGELRRSGFEVLDVSPLGGRVLDLLVIGYDVGQGRVVMRMVEVSQDRVCLLAKCDEKPGVTRVILRPDTYEKVENRSGEQ